MFHVYVQRFDEMDEKILGGKLNKAFAPGPARPGASHLPPAVLSVMAPLTTSRCAWARALLFVIMHSCCTALLSLVSSPDLQYDYGDKYYPKNKKISVL